MWRIWSVSPRIKIKILMTALVWFRILIILCFFVFQGRKASENTCAARGPQWQNCQSRDGSGWAALLQHPFAYDWKAAAGNTAVTAPNDFCIKSCSQVISLFLRLSQGVKDQKKMTCNLWCLDHAQPSVKQEEDIIHLVYLSFL